MRRKKKERKVMRDAVSITLANGITYTEALGGYVVTRPDGVVGFVTELPEHKPIMDDIARRVAEMAYDVGDIAVTVVETAIPPLRLVRVLGDAIADHVRDDDALEPPVCSATYIYAGRGQHCVLPRDHDCDHRWGDSYSITDQRIGGKGAPLSNDPDDGPALHEVSPHLIAVLTQLGDDYGPRGVARVATMMMNRKPNVTPVLNPDGEQTGWDLSDDEVAHVMEVSFGSSRRSGLTHPSAGATVTAVPSSGDTATTVEVESDADAMPSRLDRDGDTQPLPVESEHPIAHEMVKNLLDARLALGVKRYGQPLRPFNGRKPLLDSLEEALDLVVYLWCAYYESEQAVQLPVDVAELDRLRRWKAEATTVINDWNAVYDVAIAAGMPAKLGAHMSHTVREWIASQRR